MVMQKEVPKKEHEKQMATLTDQATFNVFQ